MQIMSKQLYSIKQGNSVSKQCAVLLILLSSRNQQFNSRVQQSQIVQSRRDFFHKLYFSNVWRLVRFLV